MTSQTTPVRAPGRPRSERAEKAIIDATLDLLVEEASIAGLSIEAIANRAGVGKTTIYRRWPNKEALIIDALATLKRPVPPVPGRSVHEDLVLLAEAVLPAHDRRSECVWNIVNGPDKHLDLSRRVKQEIIIPRREAMMGVVRQGMDRGELRPDIDPGLVVSMIVGTIVHHSKTLEDGQEFPGGFAEQVIDQVLRGIAA
jgi:AcrR family transcriptional regulator